MEHDFDSIADDLSQDDSLESIHDAIHNAVGSNGHMAYVPWAAFDPVFWLHHWYVVSGYDCDGAHWKQATLIGCSRFGKQ